MIEQVICLTPDFGPARKDCGIAPSTGPINCFEGGLLPDRQYTGIRETDQLIGVVLHLLKVLQDFLHLKNGKNLVVDYVPSFCPGQFGRSCLLRMRWGHCKGSAISESKVLAGERVA